MEVNQQNPGGENASITAETPIQQGDSAAAGVASAAGEPAATTAQVSSEQTTEPSSDVGAADNGGTHPVREYSDILRGKFQRLEAVALSDIERVFDLIEEHL